MQTLNGLVFRAFGIKQIPAGASKSQRTPTQIWSCKTESTRMQDQSTLHKMAGKSGEKNMQTAHVQCILPVQRESDNRTLGFTISSTSATKITSSEFGAQMLKSPSLAVPVAKWDINPTRLSPGEKARASVFRWKFSRPQLSKPCVAVSVPVWRLSALHKDWFKSECNSCVPMKWNVCCNSLCVCGCTWPIGRSVTWI